MLYEVITIQPVNRVGAAQHSLSEKRAMGSQDHEVGQQRWFPRRPCRRFRGFLLKAFDKPPRARRIGERLMLAAEVRVGKSKIGSAGQLWPEWARDLKLNQSYNFV